MKYKLSKILIDLFRDNRKQVVIEDQEQRVRVDFEISSTKPEFTQVVRDMQFLMVAKMEENFKISQAKDIREYIELGAGVIPMSNLDARIKSTDIVPSHHLDGVLDATNLEVADNCVSGFFLQNTFHHIPDPTAFFEETSRALIPGGRIVILDPYYNTISRWLYTRLFKTEDFDVNGNWNSDNSHAMIGANQALSYIVFRRDREVFNTKFPQLVVVADFPVVFGLRYILTGGVNFKRIAPGWIFRAIRGLEKFPKTLRVFAIHWIVVVEKRLSD
jgi:SAM-dependent methyltransferase